MRARPGPPPASAPVTAAPYARFVDEVARRQLAAWLPAPPARILDLSAHSPHLLDLMVDAGCTVIRPVRRPHAVLEPSRPGLVVDVAADARDLRWLAEGAVDAVVAEGAALSDALLAEVTVEDAFRVLRPGGRLLLAVESLVSGLARLADAGRWAELADVPAADVVLIPAPGGGATRCFWPEELHEMLAAAGFEVEWVRPRTVLSELAVTRALQLDPTRLAALVTTELALAEQRGGESIGNGLVASARRPR